MLRLRPVDATRGDLDPTLRLDLWDRLKAAGPEAGGRNLFELGRSPQTAANAAPIKGPIINPGPIAPPTNVPVVNAAPTLNIPLKYYGFMRPVEQGETNRGMFLDGDNVLIAGLIVGSGEPPLIVIRAIGPELSSYGIQTPLLDPTLELFDANGTQIASNDDWKDCQAAEIQATGLQPSNDRESTILATLRPGNYTAIVRGKDNSTGIGLMEVYNVQ